MCSSDLVFDALRRAPASEPRTVSSGMRRLADRGVLGWADVNGTGWVDVDTPTDVRLAEGLMARSSSSVAAASS